MPTANVHVRFELAGPARIIGVGNGDANSHESEKASERSLYNGLAQVILQSQRAGSGEVKLRALADGLQGGRSVRWRFGLCLRRQPSWPPSR